MKEIKGDLIKLALEKNFDVIVHGCNCFCTMGAGIAPKMAQTFGCDKFWKENKKYSGNIDKLGTLDFEKRLVIDGVAYPVVPVAYPVLPGQTDYNLHVVNAYTQYNYGGNKPLDYEALTLCLRKMNFIFKGKHIGLPQIGCGLAGGDWNIVKNIIEKEFIDCEVTIVIFK